MSGDKKLENQARTQLRPAVGPLTELATNVPGADSREPINERGASSIQENMEQPSSHRPVKRDPRHRSVTMAVVFLIVVTIVVGGWVALRSLANGEPIRSLEATEPTPTPMGTDRLAYGLDGDIYVADANGRNRVRIANGAPGVSPVSCGSYWGEGPIWSPDGRYLAFRGSVARGGSCHGKVNIADPAGGIVASFPGEGWKISWSPDSTRVAAWVHGGLAAVHGDRTIGIYGLDGVRQALLTLPRGLMAPGDFDPVWSRDGASLLVPFGVELPVDGSPPRQLPATDPRSQWLATYSPDGARIAYISNAVSLNVAEADGSRARVLVPEGAWDPVWSPTGDRIAFDVQRMSHFFAPTEIRMVDVASGTVMSVAGMGGTDVLGVIGFSSDGDRILFSRTDAGGVSSLWSVRADGSDPRLLVTGAYWGAWQPVGPTAARAATSTHVAAATAGATHPDTLVYAIAALAVMGGVVLWRRWKRKTRVQVEEKIG